MYRNQARVEQSAVVACMHNIVIVIHKEAARVCRQSINSVLVARGQQQCSLWLAVLWQLVDALMSLTAGACFHQKCNKFKSCAKAGLHCHHPRNCLFYLRDRDVRQLQKLLQVT